MTLPSPDRDVKDDVIEKMLEAYSAEATKGTTIYRDCMRAAVRALAENVSDKMVKAADDEFPDYVDKANLKDAIVSALRAIAGPETDQLPHPTDRIRDKMGSE